MATTVESESIRRISVTSPIVTSERGAADKTALEKIAKIVTDFWQLISAIIAIIAAIVAALTFFATRSQLTRLECLMNQSLLRQTLPGQITQLSTNIKLAQTEVKDIAAGSLAANAKMIEIDKYRDDLKAAQKQYNDLPMVSSTNCEASSEKKP